MMNILSSEKIKAAILGHAVGDALGVPVEFSSRESLELNPVTDMRGFGSHNVPEGSWSDDTSMELCALDTIANNCFSLDNVMKNFGKWYYENEFNPTGFTFDIGGTCSLAISHYFRNNTAPVLCGPDDESSNGNGSLMRIIPFGLLGYYHPDKLKQLCEDGSALTHGHMRSKIACFIYVKILLNLFDSPSKNAVYEGIKSAEEVYGTDNEWKYYENIASIKGRSADEIKSSGYVVDTLEAALWCLLNTDSYSECVLKAVNLGSDTDTVGAVAGGLAGVLYGLDAIPEKWLDTIRRRDWIEDMCNKAAEVLGRNS